MHPVARTLLTFGVITAAHPHRLTPQPRPGNFSLTMSMAKVETALEEQVIDFPQ